MKQFPTFLQGGKILLLNKRDNTKQGDRLEAVDVYLKQIVQCQGADVCLLLSDTLDYRGNDLKRRAIAAENEMAL